MINIKSKLDEIEKNVFATLKDFQLATVERIDELYRAGDRAKVTSLGSSIKLKGKAEGFEILTLDELER